MMRAVHRPQHIAFVLYLHGREHVLLVMIPVSGRFIQFHCADTRRKHMLVSRTQFFFADIILQDAPQGIAFRQEHRQASANQFVSHKQTQFPSQLSVIPLLGLFQTLQVLIQFRFLRECRSVNTGQHLIFFTAAPVGTGKACQFERLDRLHIHQMRAGAEIDKFSLLIKADLRIFRQIPDQFHLIRFFPLFHISDRLIAGKRKPGKGMSFLDDLFHLRFDLVQIFRRKSAFTVDIIIKSVFDRRSDCQFGFRIKALDRLRHHMRSRMAIRCESFRRLDRLDLQTAVLIQHRS